MVERFWQNHRNESSVELYISERSEHKDVERFIDAAVMVMFEGDSDSNRDAYKLDLFLEPCKKIWLISEIKRFKALTPAFDFDVDFNAVSEQYVVKNEWNDILLCFICNESYYLCGWGTSA
ncbi:hypothetical protein [Pleionea sediminis]|uniref:hypothetical protein n=1 Tax=Pleionea sediminis TaxID=2569479 RepID=UPI00118606FF|nr:hypothetical protein [Pleionea sediminis]